MVIAYRGSNDTRDALQNFKFILTPKRLHEQSQQAIDYAHYHINHYLKNGYRVYMTGHSLGGHLVLVASASINAKYPTAIQKVVTFDALGELEYYSQTIQQGSQDLGKRLVNYVVDGEFISRFWKGPKENVVYLSSIGGLLQKHQLSHVLESKDFIKNPQQGPIISVLSSNINHLKTNHPRKYRAFSRHVSFPWNLKTNRLLQLKGPWLRLGK